jgi:Tol biopolymer transport system component
VKLDGQVPEQHFSGQSNDDSPAWSPNSRWLAFVSDAANPGINNQPGKFDVYIYDSWTGEISQVTTGDNGYRYPAWKPKRTTTVP